MAKRSKRREVHYDKEQAGCMWGLISLFDFRRGRATRMLLTGRRVEFRNTVVSASAATKLNLLTNSSESAQSIGNDEENEKLALDGGKSSVKELMEEEMFSEQGSKKDVNISEIEWVDAAQVGHVKKNHSRLNKAFGRSFDSQNNIDLESMMEELSQIHQKSRSCGTHDSKGGSDMQSDDSYSVCEEKLSAAIMVLMNERFTNEKSHKDNGKTSYSKELKNALQLLSSNEALFLKLLQDPNSLLVKHVQGSENVRLEEEQKIQTLVGPNLLDDNVSRKHRTFFRRKSKSQENIHLKGKDSNKNNDSSQVTSRIVILKPGRPDEENAIASASLKSHYKTENQERSGRTNSQFSFTEIKRKLKHAMGKDPQEIISHTNAYKNRNLVDIEKGAGERNGGWSSPNRNHFYTERFLRFSVKRRDKTSKLNETTESPNQMVSNIYIEAKKHLSEMLSNGDESAELLSGKLPSTLGRILSLSEYNSSPIDSPRIETEHTFVTAKMRLHPGGSLIDDNQEQKVQSPDKTQEVVLGSHYDDSMREIPFSTRDEMCSEEIMETTSLSNNGNEEEREMVEASPEPNTSLISNEDQNCENSEVFDGETSSHCLKLDLPKENQLYSSPAVSPSSSSLSTNFEDCANVIDKIERPSPVSVLEPLFSEDDVSPASISQSVQSSIRPIHIQFEELSSPTPNQEMRITTSMEDEESAFEYVEAVLLASDLNWDEFLLRWLSSDQSLDPSLFDEVKNFSSRPSHDQRLLFDCTNEVLKEICDRYFGGSLLLKQIIRPPPSGMKLIQEVWEGIEMEFLQNSAQSLDQLVRKELGRSGTWMELRSETECIVSEMGDLFLEELMEETFWCISNNDMEVDLSLLSDDQE